jgi:hypothetical protein
LIEAIIYFCVPSYLIPLIIGGALWLKGHLLFVGKLFVLYILLTLAVEFTGFLLANKGIPNLWLYRLYLYVEVIFPTLFFFGYYKSKLRKIIVFSFFILVIVFITLLNFFENWATHASLQTGITFTYIAYLILNYFIEMFRQEEVINPFRDLAFLVGSIILLSQSTTFIYNLLYNQLLEGYFGSSIYSILENINIILIILYNIFYSYALWVSREHRT